MSKFNKDKIDIVCFHGSCSDGFGSAFIVWLYYKQKYGLQRANYIEYIPCYHQAESKELSESYLSKFKNKNIMMCDFAYQYDITLQLIFVTHSLVILDHHITTQKNLENIPVEYKILDMKRSGVGITWDFFYPKQQIPKFLAHIQDRDLWENKLENTDEFVTFFYDQKFDFYFWETFMDDSIVNESIEIGKSWLSYKNIIVEKIIKKTSCVIHEINDQYVIVTYSNSSEFKSEIGNKIFEHIPMADFSCIWDYNLCENITTYSFRSTDDRFDVNEIANKIGGGGHRNSSACKLIGNIGCLPFPVIPNQNILSLLSNCKKENISVEFEVDKLYEYLTESKCLDLIRRKYKDSNLIIFTDENTKERKVFGGD